MRSALVIISLLLLLSSYVAGRIILPLGHNIRNVKATKIPYVVVPFYHYNLIVARFYSRTVLRFLNWLSPDPSVVSWRRLAAGLWPLKLRYAPFEALDKGVFWVVSPGGRILNIADADINDQILKRETDFPKAIQIYDLIRIYGDNVVSSDGLAMKHHRNITMPAFGPRNERAVWEASLDAAKVMVESTRRADQNFGTVEKITDNIRRLSLEVLGRAALGERLEWTSETKKSLPGDAPTSSESTSFAGSLEYIMTHVTWVMMVKNLPNWTQIIGRIFLTSFKEAMHHYDLWGAYMIGMIQAKRQAIASGEANTSTVDLLGQLIKGQSEDANKLSKWAKLTDSEVLGNLFALIVAGHDTAAHTTHNALVYLAQNPRIQQKLQKELRMIFEGRPVSEWTFERDYRILRSGFLGAIMQETLRLISPVLTIPKNVASTAEPLVIDGESVDIPKDSLIRIVIPATHRNPKFWPHGSPTKSKKPAFLGGKVFNDLEEFKPDRWLNCGPTNKDSPLLFTPEGGSYLPFSGGSRACIGQRFAEVEIVATLAMILSQYSVELAVDKTDKEVFAMSQPQRKAAWEEAYQAAEDKMQNKMTCLITVQLQKDASIPLRFANSGEERFFDI